MPVQDPLGSIPWNLDKKTSPLRHLLAALTVLVIGGPLYAAGDWVSDDNEMLLYLGSGILGALYLGRGPARVASLLCLFILHAAQIHPGFRLFYPDFQVLISFGFFLLVTDQIARIADQARRETWLAHRKEKAGEVLRQFAERCATLESAQQLDGLLEQETARFAQDPPSPGSQQLVVGLREQWELAKERLQHRDRLRQDEVLRATQKLQSTLINSISHDLKTPLSTISGTVDTLRLSGEKLCLADRQELLLLASEQIQRLEKLVKNILNLSKMEAGGLSLARDWVSIPELLAFTRGRLPKQAMARIQMEVPEDLPEVKGDFTLLGQVFANLFDNALKFSSEAIRIEACTLGADSVLISVVDRGVGVPETEVGQIFDKFFRAKTPMAVPGSGLGLHICKGVVELHQGSLQCESVADGGSRFAVRLPLEPSLAGSEPFVACR